VEDAMTDAPQEPKLPFPAQHPDRPCLFLASNADSSQVTGTVLEVMGGETTG
jgi:hypothetical protein